MYITHLYKDNIFFHVYDLLKSKGLQFVMFVMIVHYEIGIKMESFQMTKVGGRRSGIQNESSMGIGTEDPYYYISDCPER